jgi:hypothetical protein
MPLAVLYPPPLLLDNDSAPIAVFPKGIPVVPVPTMFSACIPTAVLKSAGRKVPVFSPAYPRNALSAEEEPDS